MIRWGIDLGGTKIECAVLDDANNMRVITRRRVPTEAHKGYPHIISQIKLLIDLVKEETGLSPATIGFATPGVLDPLLQVMKNCNTVVMNGQPMKTDIETALGIPVVLANDANCFALAEANMGAARKVHENPEVVFGVIMGSGVGGGIVVNGKVLTGRQGIAGEWGHNVLEPNGTPCYCGKAGCNETIFSGNSLERFYAEKSGTKRKLHEVLERHLNGTDADATATINRLLDSYAKAISAIINVLDPDVIVLGGGVSNIDLLYTEGFERIKKYVFNNRLDTIIVKPELGDSAGVFGAALLA